MKGIGLNLSPTGGEAPKQDRDAIVFRVAEGVTATLYRDCEEAEGAERRVQSLEVHRREQVDAFADLIDDHLTYLQELDGNY